MIYIFGHKKPDTDSICSSIALSYLKNQLGYKTEPRTLGSLNNEIKFVLNKFDFKEPKYLHDVKLQIKDLVYQKNCYLNERLSIYDGYSYMKENGLSGIPIVNNLQKLTGLVTLKEIARELIEGDFSRLDTNYDLLLKVIDGVEVLRFNDEIEGTVKAASYKSTTILETVNFNSNDIVIVGDRHSVLEYAINSKIQLLVVVGDCEVKEEHLKLAKENKVSIIKTHYDTFTTTKLINLSNYLKTVSFKEPISFETSDYFSNFEEKARKYKHTNYPILNNKNECVGMLRMIGLIEKKPKQVILVDHNEKEQSVDYLEEAEIIEVVDHHKLNPMSTSRPINFRNMAVGSTCTIVYNLFKENNISIPKNIAGLLISGIISDTLMLKSPTKTRLDEEAMADLQKITGIDYIEYGKEMFKAGSSLVGKTKEQILFTDFKRFTAGDYFIGIGQINTTDVTSILDELDEYVSLINKIAVEQNYKITALFVTDVINNGSYLIYNEDSKLIFEKVLNKDIKQGIYLKGIVSRKKQIIPVLMEELEK